MPRKKKKLDLEARELSQDEEIEKLVTLLFRLIREKDISSIRLESYVDHIPSNYGILKTQPTGWKTLTVMFKPKESK